MPPSYDNTKHPRDERGHWIPSDQRGMAGKAMGYLAGDPQNAPAGASGNWHEVGDYLIHQDDKGVVRGVHPRDGDEKPHHAKARKHLIGTAMSDLVAQAKGAGHPVKTLPLSGATHAEVRRHQRGAAKYHANLDRAADRLAKTHPRLESIIRESARHLKGEGYRRVLHSDHHDDPSLGIKRFAAKHFPDARHLGG